MKRLFILILFACTGWLMAAAQPKPEKPVVGKDGTIRHSWFGVRIGYIGDSVTDAGCYTDVKRYWSFLDDWLNTTSFVYAVNGRQWDDVPRQAEQLKNEHGKEVDAILVFMGTNDYNSGIPIGEWYTEAPEQVRGGRGQMMARVRRTLVMNQHTFKGRINVGISRLKQLFPDKQIVLLTPLHRAYATFGEDNVQPDESYQNSCGEYIDAYVQAVKEAGNLWGVPVIDLNACSGLNPMVDEQMIYFRDKETDRLHPNTWGQERIARTLLYQLLAIPALF